MTTALHDETKRHIIDGLLADLVTARQCFELLRLIGERADDINALTFGPFFDVAQRGIMRNYILSTARIFDRPNKKFPVRSLPALLQTIKTNPRDFPVLQPFAWRSRLRKWGVVEADVEGLADDELRERMIDQYMARMPNDSPTVESLSSTVAHEALRTTRDKEVAHSEHVPPEAKVPLNWDQVQSLLDLAEDALGVLAFGLFSVVLTDDNNRSILQFDVERPRRSLQRMLATLLDARIPSAIDAPE